MRRTFEGFISLWIQRMNLLSEPSILRISEEARRIRSDALIFHRKNTLSPCVMGMALIFIDLMAISGD